MPAPGDQYRSNTIKNPFEEPERQVSAFTAVEIATLQSRLNQQLGPEFISSRRGNGGGNVAYLEGNRAIALANEVFGFNGWSSSLGHIEIDYVDENPQNGRISLGLSINVKITLKDGTYHEDIGYGTADNIKGKGPAFQKAKKEAATDGLKRALRTFGNLLGNCLYDKAYLSKVSAMKVKPAKFDIDKLYRHPDYAPPATDGNGLVKAEPTKALVRSEMARDATEESVKSAITEFEDEFGGDVFDGVEIGEEHGSDEFTFETASIPEESAPKLLEVPKDATGPNRLPPNRNNQGSNNEHARQPMSRVQSMPTMRTQNGSHQPGQLQDSQHQGVGRLTAHLPQARAPQTPNAPPNNGRPDMNRGRMAPPTGDARAASRPQLNQNAHPLAQNQSAGNSNPEAQPNQPHPNPANSSRNTTSAPNPPTTHRPPVGFVTSRAAELLQNTDSPVPQNLPAFNPNAESPLPQEKRTPGIDHTRSMKVTRQEVQQPTVVPPQAPGQVPAGQRAGAITRTNFVNPHQDVNRRIGMPGAAMSPLANRSAYKPPNMVGVKRPPLADVSNREGNGGIEPESKRARVEVAGAGEEKLGV
ncbi:hypothetical protein CC78DRAFT_566769 [Lojkania enalia]|uniref:RAD52 homolog n=1 Tax=Lojkania enalia TaxID=147567 RepID=A0A9P4KDK8_9PLEO|nr:hypothetical protein CC78DRAFT_566769 [Didymosphaeria enalia]